MPLLLLGLSGCEALGIGVTGCTSVGRPGFRLILTDSVSGLGVVADEIVGIATSATLSDTLRITNADSAVAPELTLVEDVAGTYDVTVDATGYLTWSRSDLDVVNRDECHVITRDEEVRMVRESR